MPQNTDVSVESLTVETLGTMGAQEFDAMRAQLAGEPDGDARRAGFARLRNLIRELNSEPEPEEEVVETSVEEVLGLRPVFVHSDDPHPDDRPCPPWCWTHKLPGLQHTVHQYSPELARHSYSGVRIRHSAAMQARPVENGWRLAEISAELRSYGQEPPAVHLRTLSGADGELKHALSLTIEDACELVTVLTYLVDVAEGRREVIEAGGEE